jgi:hypothetical protein
MTFHVYEDVDADMTVSEFAWDHGVQYVPTMILVAPDGTELERWEGYVPEPDLRVSFDVNL